jgi:GMP synthase (glutamine-hydrolysing)
LIIETDMDLYIDHIIWLKEYPNPILGICFGHQLIGLLYGAFGSRMKENRDWVEIEVFKESLLFEKLPTVFEVMEDHCENISIPIGFELLASSDECINEAMQHKEKMIYSLQFNPEVSGNFGVIIIENFINITRQNNF